VDSLQRAGHGSLVYGTDRAAPACGALRSKRALLAGDISQGANHHVRKREQERCPCREGSCDHGRFPRHRRSHRPSLRPGRREGRRLGPHGRRGRAITSSPEASTPSSSASKMQAARLRPSAPTLPIRRIAPASSPRPRRSSGPWTSS
jgi:hypothetical protein